MTIDFMSFGHQDTDSFSGFCCSISRSFIKVIDQGFFRHHSDSVDPSNGGDTLGAGKVGNSFPEASLATSPYAIWMSLMDIYGHLWTMDVTLALVFNWCSTGVQLRSVQRWPQGQAFVSGQMLAI